MQRRSLIPMCTVVGICILALAGCTSFSHNIGQNHTNTTAVQSNGTTANQTTPKSSDSANPSVTLEQIQFVDNALLLVMTRGSMETTYAHPHFSAGPPTQFIVTLRNTSPGKFPLNKRQPVHANWADSMLMTKSGNDLVLTLYLTKTFSSFQVGIAGGSQIQFSFQ